MIRSMPHSRAVIEYKRKMPNVLKLHLLEAPFSAARRLVPGAGQILDTQTLVDEVGYKLSRTLRDPLRRSGEIVVSPSRGIWLTQTCCFPLRNKGAAGFPHSLRQA